MKVGLSRGVWAFYTDQGRAVGSGLSSVVAAMLVGAARLNSPCSTAPKALTYAGRVAAVCVKASADRAAPARPAAATTTARVGGIPR